VRSDLDHNTPVTRDDLDHHAPRHWTQHAHPQYSIDCSSIEHILEDTRNPP
jgi:hypothetical protein